MLCPYCDLYITNPATRICPRCGQPLEDAARLGFANARVPAESYGPMPSGQSAPQRYPDMPPPDWNFQMSPTPELPRRSGARRAIKYIIGGIGAVLLLVCCLGGLAFIGLRTGGHQSSSPTPFPGTTPDATILFQDTLTSNTNNGWANDSDCFFQDGSYHIAGDFICYAPAGNIGDAAISVQAKQISGSLRWLYGIVFRRVSKGNFYQFGIDSNSHWYFGKEVNGTTVDIVQFTPNLAIKGGLNTLNTLLVRMKGSHFAFYVNGTKVGEADDTTFTTGLSGLRGGPSIEVAYNNFQITTVS